MTSAANGVASSPLARSGNAHPAAPENGVKAGFIRTCPRGDRLSERRTAIAPPAECPTTKHGVPYSASTRAVMSTLMLSRDDLFPAPMRVRPWPGKSGAITWNSVQRSSMAAAKLSEFAPAPCRNRIIGAPVWPPSSTFHSCGDRLTVRARSMC